MYQIKLPVFEGPFDLLLFLIKKNEIDIYDIPIADITRQYLEYLELMKMFNLEIAGEFIEMVATLMLIKVRMLLPNPPTEDDEEPVDPRIELVNQLLEYKRFKEASQQLKVLEEENRRYFPRQLSDLPRQFQKEENEFPLSDVTLFDLLTAFKRALNNMPKVTVHQVQTIKVTIEEQVEFILNKLSGKKYLLFSELLQDISEKIRLIVTLIALLDLMRLRIVSARQSDIFGEIRLIPLQQISLSEYLEMRDRSAATPE